MTVSTREEYYTEYEAIGQVWKLGDDWLLKDTKSLSQRFKNVDLISQTKKIILQKMKKENLRFKDESEKN